MLFIKWPETAFQIFHHMGIVLRCRRALALMAYCATYLIERVWLDIRVGLIGLRHIGHFGILDTYVARHAAISNLQLRGPNLLHLKWSGKELLLEIGII